MRQHTITRVRHPLRFRRLTVRRVESVTPAMRRIVLGGDDLGGFVTAGFDDHVKVFVPDGSGRLPEPIVGENGLRFPEDAPAPPGRDYTPRFYDAARRELTIDFGLHGQGPATAWATTAAPGSILGVAGPRGSAVISDTFDWHLFVGDDTALPAIARRLEQLPAGVIAIVIAEVDGRSGELPLPSAADVSVQWLHRRGASPDAVADAVRQLQLPAGDGFAWVAGEASMARVVRRHLIDDRRLDAAWVKAAAYWRAGATGRHEVITD